jgi:hypothetical protein
MSITVKNPKTYLRFMLAFAFSIQIHLAQSEYIKSRLLSLRHNALKLLFQKKGLQVKLNTSEKKCSFDCNLIIIGAQYTIAIEKLQEQIIK